MFTISLPGLIFKSPVVVIVDPLIAKVSMITEPVPDVLNSKLLFDVVVVIKLSSINISPVLNVSAVILPVLAMSETIIEPLTLKLFVDSLNKANVKQLNPIGETFDPQKHEAMSMQDAPEKVPGSVLMVFQKGYTLNDRVIRPARVVVVKGKPASVDTKA